MAMKGGRRLQHIRDAKGRYVKLTILNRLKAFCNRFICKLDKAIGKSR